MDRPLFVYGTLRDPDLLAAVLGRRPDARNMAPAAAPGFRTVTYPGRPYPALLRAPGAAAEGTVLVGLTRLERTILDAYEGEEYRRMLIPVIVEGELHEAETYLPTASIGPDAEPWSLRGWQERHKPAVFEAESRAAAEIRAQLKAARAR
jgi:hypothetical protein